MANWRGLMYVALVVVIFAGIGGYLYASGERQTASLSYPSLQESYEECVVALQLAKTDMPAFQRSGCARQINGVLSGIYIISGRIQPPLYEPHAACSEVKAEMYEALSRIICLDEKRFSRNEPAELVLAKDFVQYLGSKYKRDTGFVQPHIAADTPMLDAAAIFADMYSCANHSRKGDKK